MINKAKIFTLVSLSIVGIGLSACETVDGVGRDLENAGETVQEAAK